MELQIISLYTCSFDRSRHDAPAVPAVGNFTLSDYTTFLATTGFCAPFGYFVGEDRLSFSLCRFLTCPSPLSQ